MTKKVNQLKMEKENSKIDNLITKAENTGLKCCGKENSFEISVTRFI